MKSVVVEIKQDFAAVLSDDGSIVKIKNKNYVIGQVIVMKKHKLHITKKMALIAASVAVVVLSGGVGVWAYTTPYTYVSMDVNPSIEYTLNRFDRVIDVTAVNDDGQDILDEIDVDALYHQPIEDAILTTVDQMTEDGYFNSTVTDVASGDAIEVTTEDSVLVATDSAIDVTNSSETSVATDSAIEVTNSSEVLIATDSAINIDGGIVITVSNENGESSEELANELGEIVTENVSEDVVVEVFSVGYERVLEARRLGVTPGKLNLVEKLRASTAEPDSIDMEEWLHKPVKEIMKATKENKKLNREEVVTVTNEIGTTEDAEDTEDSVDVEDMKDIEDTKDAEVIEAKEEIKAEEKAKEAQEEAEEKAKEAQEKAEEKAKEAQEKAEEKAKEAQKKVEEKAKEEQAKAEEKAKEAQEKAEEKAKEEQAKAEEKAKEEQAKAEEKAKEAQAKEAQAKAEEKAKEAQEKAEEKAKEAQEKQDKAKEKENGKPNATQNTANTNSDSSNAKPKK